jgi:cysteine desulfurase/selenocysteine lyase
LIADTEFLQVAISWEAQVQTAGVEIVPVRPRLPGAPTADDFARAMTGRSRVLCTSSVQWTSGYRADLAALGDLCRARGVYLVVDAVQELGACPIDVRVSSVDVLVAGGHKWLNAPFGCGILYLAPRILAEREPASYGYLSLVEPKGGWGEYFRTESASPFSDWRFVRTAKRFEVGGTSNYPGARPRCDKSTSLGSSARLGARVVSPCEPRAARSGITTFRCHNNPAEDRALLERLLEAKVYLAMRYTSGVGGIRVSTHFFNNQEDIERLIAVVKKSLSRPDAGD